MLVNTIQMQTEMGVDPHNHYAKVSLCGAGVYRLTTAIPEVSLCEDGVSPSITTTKGEFMWRQMEME